MTAPSPTPTPQKTTRMWPAQTGSLHHPPPTSTAPDRPQPSLNTHAHIHPPYPPQPCRQTGFQAEPPPGCSVINGFLKISLTSRSPRPGRLRVAEEDGGWHRRLLPASRFPAPDQTTICCYPAVPCRAVLCRALPRSCSCSRQWRDRDMAGDPS